MGRFNRRQRQQCPSQSRSSQHCAQSSAFHSTRLPSVGNSDAHLADAPGLSAKALKKELKNLKITKGNDGSTTLSFQVKANSYSLGYAFKNGHSNGGPATVIQSRDRCGRMTTSRSTDLSGRYRVETSPQKDGSVAFKVKLDASLTRARLSLGNKSLVIDPNALEAGDTKSRTPQKAPKSTPSPRSYDEPSPSDFVVPETDPAKETKPDTTTAQGTTNDPAQKNTPSATQRVAPAQKDLPAGETQTAGGSSTQPATQEPKEQVVRPEYRAAPTRNQEVETKVAAVAKVVAGKTTAEGHYPFKVNNYAKSYSANYGGMVGYMHVDADGTPEMRTLWSLSDFHEDGQWSDYPLTDYDQNGQISTALKGLPENAPNPDTVRPLRYSNGEGTQGYAFPRWTADGERGTLVVQKSEHLPPSVAYVYDKAAELAQDEGELKTFTAIKMPASKKQWEGNVHGWLAPDGRVLFTYNHDGSYRVYDPLAHIDHVRERRFKEGREGKDNRYATLKSSWDTADGYRPIRQTKPENFSPVTTLKELWGN